MNSVWFRCRREELRNRVKVAVLIALLGLIIVSIFGCVSIPIPSSIPLPNNIPILSMFI